MDGVFNSALQPLVKLNPYWLTCFDHLPEPSYASIEKLKGERRCHAGITVMPPSSESFALTPYIMVCRAEEKTLGKNGKPATFSGKCG